MKKFFVKIAAIVAAAAMLASQASADIYHSAGRVVVLDALTDTVIVEDGAGNLYSFQGVEDYCLFDMVALLMDDCNTESILDDEIIFARYAGRFE